MSKVCQFYRLCCILVPMKIGVSRGYTVVESMIFLAVSSALFVMVILTLQGRQAQAEFSAATREMESRIKDVINDVETGYYAGTENLECTVQQPRGELDFDPIDGQRGTSGDCIFIGKAIQFGVTGDDKAYNVFSIAGARTTWASGKTTNLISNYDGSRATAIEQATQHMRLPTGLVFAGMRTNQGLRSTVAFMAPFNSYLNMQEPGSLNLRQVAALPAFDLTGGAQTHDEAAVKKLISAINGSNQKLNLDRILTPYVEVCLNGDAVKRHVIYQIGNAQRRGEVEVIIGEGACPSTFTS